MREESLDAMGRRLLISSLICGIIVVGSWIVRAAVDPSFLVSQGVFVVSSGR